MRAFAFVLFFSFLRLENFTSNNLFKVLLTLLILTAILHNVIVSKKGRSLFRLPKYIYALIIIIIVGVFRNGNPNATLSSDFYKLLIFLLLIICLVQVIHSFLRKKKGI